MPRMIWKGAISFGLVHVPVGLYPASQDSGVHFEWIDQRTLDPVGYKRINKRTGKEVDKEQIVKGIRQPDGDYVVLSDAEVEAAYPKTTQTISIEAFVPAADVPFVHLDRPYFLEPIGKSDKVYALLREAMLADGVIGIARVVMHAKEHLAALIASGPALVLNTLRWSTDVRDAKDLALPAAGAKSLSANELKMAKQLVQGMTVEWKPEQYEDRFADAIHRLVAARVKAGKTKKVEPLEDAAPAPESNVIDLAELLRRSLSERKSPKRRAEAKDEAANDETAPATKKAARKTAARKRA